MMEIISSLDSSIQITLIIIFGLIFGSFISLLSYRAASKQAVVFTRSKCVKCGIILKIRNLIPLFSWIFQRGKCSSCKGKISLRYLIIELSCVIVLLVVYFALGQQINYKMILYCLISATLILMIITDLEHYFIPNLAQYFLAFFVIVATILEGGTNAALLNVGSALIYMAFGLALLAFFYFTAKIEAIGIDDIKFFFIAGLMLTMKDFLMFMLLSGIFGIIFGFCWQKIKKEQTFPFAPALCLSMFICMLFDKKINPVDLIGSLLFL